MLFELIFFVIRAKKKNCCPNLLSRLLWIYLLMSIQGYLRKVGHLWCIIPLSFRFTFIIDWNFNAFRSDLSRFEYLTMTIKESLRLHNVVPVIGRTLEEPLTISSELQSSQTTLPSNLNVLLPLGLQTRNPSLWENSEVINCCLSA